MLFVTSLVACSACILGIGDVKNMDYRPGGIIMTYMPQGGSDVYEHGWKDGCESGMATGFSKKFQQQFYAFKKDLRFGIGYKYGDERDLFNGRTITDADKTLYNRVWGDTYKACRHYAVGSLQGGGFKRPTISGESIGRMDNAMEVVDLRNVHQGGEGGIISNW